MIFPPASMSVLAWFSGVILTGPADVGKTCVWDAEYASGTKQKESR